MKSSLLVCLSILCISPTICQIPQQAGLDQLIGEAQAKAIFSGNVFVAKQGQSVYFQSVGYKNKQKEISNDSTTQFQIGSVTKLFTKTLILQLAELDKLSTSATVGQYFPDFPPHLKPITIQQLLDHTSGLGSYYNVDGYEEASGNISSIRQVLDFVKKEELQFKPGTDNAYSNSGYVVLAGLVEILTGKQYGVVLKENILDKLGMQSTSFSVGASRSPRLATGYLSNQPGTLKSNEQFNIVGAGDGGIFSTTNDLLKFIVSIASNNKLLPDSRKVELVNSPLFPIQYGNWAEFKSKGRLAVAGGAPGISAVVGFNMATGYQIVVLSNFDEGSAEEMYRRVGAVLRNEPPEPFALSPARLIYSFFDSKNALTESEFRALLKKNGVALEDDMPLLFAGQALLQEKRWDAALALYKAYTAMFPGIVVAWNDLGDVNHALNNKSDAKKCYEKALSLRPGNPRALEALKKLGD